jgi:hypothetical protein
MNEFDKQKKEFFFMMNRDHKNFSSMSDLQWKEFCEHQQWSEESSAWPSIQVLGHETVSIAQWNELRQVLMLSACHVDTYMHWCWRHYSHDFSTVYMRGTTLTEFAAGCLDMLYVYPCQLPLQDYIQWMGSSSSYQIFIPMVVQGHWSFLLIQSPYRALFCDSFHHAPSSLVVSFLQSQFPHLHELFYLDSGLRQFDGVSCGVFSLFYAEYYWQHCDESTSERSEVPSPTITQIQQFRLQMARRLMELKYHWPLSSSSSSSSSSS